VLAGSNVMYAVALLLARIVLGSVGFRELLNTLELPGMVIAVASVVLLGHAT
jgi:hypothetical protein